MFRKIKWALQKVFRKTHTSDREVWGLYYSLAKINYKKLSQFKKYPLQGHPFDFSEYDEHAWRSKEEYDKAKEQGDIVGGESEAWLATIDEMLFAFDWIIHYDSGNEKQQKVFLKKWDLEDPWEKKESNRRESYWYRRKDDGLVMTTGQKLSADEMATSKYILDKVDTYYFNSDLEKEIGQRLQKGLELFGKYFMNLWD